MTKPETLCFHCDNLFCAWRQKESPVNGWKAVPTTVKSGKNYLPSYIVFACPNFSRQQGYQNDDEWLRIRKKGYQETIYLSLAEILKECAGLDYAALGKITAEALKIESMYESEKADQERRIIELIGDLANAITEKEKAEKQLKELKMKLESVL